MGPASANPTAHRDGRGGVLAIHAAPNPLLGRWFGYPGASVGRRMDTRTAGPPKVSTAHVSTTHTSTKHGSVPKNTDQKTAQPLYRVAIASSATGLMREAWPAQPKASKRALTMPGAAFLAAIRALRGSNSEGCCANTRRHGADPACSH